MALILYILGAARYYRRMAAHIPSQERRRQASALLVAEIGMAYLPILFVLFVYLPSLQRLTHWSGSEEQRFMSSPRCSMDTFWATYDRLWATQSSVTTWVCLTCFAIAAVLFSFLYLPYFRAPQAPDAESPASQTV